MSKRYWILLICIILLATGFFIIKQWNSGSIEIDIKQVRTTIRNDSLHASILLENGTLSFLTKFTDSIKFKVTLDSFQVAQGTIDYTTKTDSLNYVLIPGYLSMKDMQTVIRAEGDSAWLTINTVVTKKLPLIGMQIWEGEKKIRIIRPKPPEYSQTDISDFSFQRDTIRFTLEGYIHNYNPIAITLVKTGLRMRIDDRFNAFVAMPPDLSIPPADSVFVETKIEIHEFQVLKDGLAILFSKDALPYLVTGNVIIHLDSVDILEPIDMDIVHTGQLSLSPFAKKN